jgi:hypothetical protein
MKGHRVATILVLVCMLRLPAWPHDQEKGHQVLTKLQIFFSELETQWLKAAQEKDPAALNRVVADDFHVWTSAPPGNPIPREEWFAGVFGRKILSSHLRQLAVRNLSPEIAVVSFVQSETYQQTATPQTEEYFVVDVWINTGSGDNWRCTDRYVSEVRSASRQK